MDSRTGDLYPSKADALAAGVPDEAILEVMGKPKAIQRVKRRIRMVARKIEQRRASRRKMQKQSRKANASR